MFGFGDRRPDGRLGPVRSFLIYYGPAGAEPASRLRSADLAVLELRQWQPDEIAELRRAGVRVYGYWSVMESADWDRERMAAISPDDVLTGADGFPIRFEQWRSVLMDLRSSRYRAVLLSELDALVASYRPDGVFVDTAGDIEDYVAAPLQLGMTNAYRSLLAVVTGRYPQLKRLQNRGFSLLGPCADQLDGLLWEGFDADALATGWSRQRLAELAGYRKRGLTVLTASLGDDPRHRAAAERHGFVHWTIPPAGYL